MNYTNRIYGLRTTLAMLVALSVSSSVIAQFFPTYVGPVPNADFKVGRVMARSIVIDADTGQPILVEFDKEGKEVGEVDLGSTPIDDVAVIPAADHRFFKLQLKEYRDRYKETLAKGAELITRHEYEQNAFMLADNQSEVFKLELKEGINSVLIRGQANRIRNDPKQFVLLKFSLDMTQDINIPDSNVSLVVNKEGQIIANSDNNIGYRTGFFGDPNEPQNDRGFRVTPDDEVFGPLSGVKVSVDDIVYPGGVDVTDEDGKYSFQFYMPLCPIGGFTFSTDVTAELRYKNFLPTGSPSIPYYLRTPGYSYCYADLVPAFIAPEIIGIMAAFAVPNIQSNLYADVMFVTGNIVIKNTDGEKVKTGDTTTYTSFGNDAENVTQKFYDFNGDRENDFVLQGRLFECTNTETNSVIDVFRAEDSGAEDPEGYQCEETYSDGSGEGNRQAIFFDGSQDNEFDFPDLIRIIDQELREEPIGVLKSISAADLRNTDLLFFRESTGQLIMERRGLKEAEANYRRAIEYDEENNEVAYRVMLRGRSDSRLNVGGGVRRNQSFEDWATEYQLEEPFRKRESDHPRPGEFIKIVAINRATGYTGTARVQLKSAGDNGTGLLDVPAPRITLQAPNLKIWAERNYKVEQGFTKGVERTYTIGNEGAALTSDTTITIFTEWLDEEGKPLPDELGKDNGEEYGLTGRLAKVVGANILQGVSAGSDLAEFPIAPGRNTQVIRVKDNLTTADHFYVHVLGKPKDQECASNTSCPSFDLSGGEAPYDSRPKLITPFLTPLPDEDFEWEEYNAYRVLKDEFEKDEENSDLEEPIKPLPAYVWEYRPEYQFSQFKLEVQELRREASFEINGVTYISSEDILNTTIPSLASADELITLFYSLVSTELERLTPIGGSQDLVLAFGEDELLITLGADQSISFDNIDHLASLSPEDFLTMRLYINQDSANILWEWAFYLDLEFVDRFNQPIAEHSTASYPKPVIHLGRGSDLSLIGGNHIQIDGNGATDSLTLSGKVYCDLADLIKDGLADIPAVIIRVERPQSGGSQLYTVALQDISDLTVQDIRPFAKDEKTNKIEDENHAYIGFFETVVELELASGAQDITVFAQNVIGNRGSGSLTVNIDSSGDYDVIGVRNDDRLKLSRGVFQPVWVRVTDDDISQDNIAEKSVTFMGAEHKLIEHDDKRHYADKPFLFVTKPLTLEGIDNVRDVFNDSADIDGEYDNEAGVPPRRESLSPTYTIARPIIVDDDEWEANTYTYAAGSTVSVYWATSDLDGWEIDDELTKVYEQNVQGFRKYLPTFLRSDFTVGDLTEEDSDYQLDEESQIVKIIEKEKINGKQIYQIVVRLDKAAEEHGTKRIFIVLTKTVDGEEQYEFTSTEFKVSPLKTIILAVDGLAYKTALALINGAGAPNFKRIFGNGKALGLGEPALSALPTITWANWPGIFSGQPPGKHGWLGNSYFPRESTSGNFVTGNFKYPIFSSGAEEKFDFSTASVSIDVQQQIGVALGGAPPDLSLTYVIKEAISLSSLATRVFVEAQLAHAYSMNRRSLDSAKSLYDTIANELNASSDEPLIARSVKVFYDRSKSDSVDLDSSYFSIFDPTHHSKAAAANLDNGEYSDGGLFQGLGSQGSAPLARTIWESDGDEIDIMAIYLPGTDNAGHAFGNADLDFPEFEDSNGIVQTGLAISGNQQVDVTNPPDVLRQHASTALDESLGKLLDEIQLQGQQNSVLFAVTADHGQHTFRNSNAFVLLTKEVGKLFSAPRANGGMDMVFWDGTNYDESQAVYSPNGAFGQFYLREQDKTWQNPPKKEDVERLAALLYRESLGLDDVQLICEMKPRLQGTPCQEFTAPGQATETIVFDETGSDGIYGRVPAIFVRLSDDGGNHFMANYRWVKDVVRSTPAGVLPVDYSLVLGSIDEFISVSQKGPDQWPALKERINELNHKNATGSRSGDVITILNGEQGHLTVNNTGEIYAGWHGGPTKSESDVPLFFALLGNDFTDEAGKAVAIPNDFKEGYDTGVVDAGVAADGYLRNWHLANVLKKILKNYRGETP